ncbi:F-box protein, partial [Trifolium medium]|nr:F-box protein [Trifolium medium]
SKLALWNQATNEFKHIPPSSVQSCIPDAAKDFCPLVTVLHGFGYDRGTCDYKVIRRVLLQYHCEYMPLRADVFGDASLLEPLEIYSLRSNSWKKLDVDVPWSWDYNTEGMQVYMDGVCHWLAKEDNESCLVSFYLSNEVFFTTPIPSDIYERIVDQTL